MASSELIKEANMSSGSIASFRVFGLPTLLALILCAGCAPQPIAHKKVKKRPLDPFLISSRATSAEAPKLLRDGQVQPAALVVPTFEERTEKQVAAEALSQIGPQAIPELRHALGSPEPRIRREAAGVLARMGPDAKDAVPDLIRLLDDEDESTRKIAARALGRIGPDAAAAVPALMRTLLESETPPPR